MSRASHVVMPYGGALLAYPRGLLVPNGRSVWREKVVGGGGSGHFVIRSLECVEM